MIRVKNINGHKISALTLGTVQLGIPYGINNGRGMPTYAEAAKILDTALSLGVTTFDTAKNYGKSEAVLGRYFSSSDKEKTIVTKFELSGEGEGELHDAVFAKVEDSLRTLALDRIPILMLHCESYLDTYGAPLLRVLSELKASGLVGSLGISFQDKSRIWEHLCSGIFDCVQLPVNMLDSYEIRGGDIKQLSELGVAVFIRSVYLQGLFFKDIRTLPDRLMPAAPILTELRSLADGAGISMAALAMGYIRAARGVSSLVMGCDTPEQLCESAALFDAPPLDSRLVESIDALAEKAPPIVIRPWEWNKK